VCGFYELELVGDSLGNLIGDVHDMSLGVFADSVSATLMRWKLLSSKQGYLSHHSFLRKTVFAVPTFPNTTQWHNTQ
jgi:hypothetical protein